MTAQAGSDQVNKYCVSLTTQLVKHGVFLDDHQSRNKPGPTGFTFDEQTRVGFFYFEQVERKSSKLSLVRCQHIC